MRAIPVAAATIAFLVFVVLPASPDHRRMASSLTKEFFINGKGYRLEKSPGDDASLVRRELLRVGLDLPVPETSPAVQPLVADSLSEKGGDARPGPIQTPRGLRTEHVLHLKSDSGQVGIALGSMESRGPSVRSRLPAAGWKCVEPLQGPEPVTVAIRKEGKETLIVFLEETKGRFLLLRKPD